MPDRPLQFVVTGAQFGGNKGAVAMAQVVTAGILARYPDARIALVGKYPGEERQHFRRLFGDTPNVHLLECPQWRATCVELPLAGLGALAGGGLPKRLSRLTPLLGAADVAVDIGGTTFSEERGPMGLAINATCVLLAILNGIPTVKLAQSFGPVRAAWLRRPTRALLGRLDKVVARGSISLEELRRLDLPTEPVQCADLAFLLPAEQAPPAAPQRPAGKALVAGVAPNSVLAAKLGLARYGRLMVGAVERLVNEHGVDRVWLVAHSVRASNTLSNNDVPVCRWIHARLGPHARARTNLVVGDHTPGELRAVIARTDVLFACRLHAMISALASGVPVAALGWGHKYREVLAQFGLDTCLDYGSARAAAIHGLLDRLVRERKVMAQRIAARLPAAVESARANFDVLGEVIQGLDAPSRGKP